MYRRVIPRVTGLLDGAAERGAQDLDTALPGTVQPMRELQTCTTVEIRERMCVVSPLPFPVIKIGRQRSIEDNRLADPANHFAAERGAYGGERLGERVSCLGVGNAGPEDIDEMVT